MIRFKYALIDKRKPTVVGYLEFIMNQEQVFQLILALIQQGCTDPDEIVSTIKTISEKVF